MSIKDEKKKQNSEENKNVTKIIDPKENEAKKETSQEKNTGDIKYDNKNENIDDIIKSHIIFSMTAGAIPLPLVDFVAVTAIQLDMLKQIAIFYKIDYDQNKGKSLASSLIGTSLAKMGASVIKALPGIGTLAGIGAQVILSGTSTYALGKVFKAHFEDNGTLLDFDVKVMKKKYREFFDKGENIVKKYRDEQKVRKKEDVMDTIEKLKGLKDRGAITEKDFERTKEGLLKKIK